MFKKKSLKNLKVMKLKPTIVKNINLADLCLNLVNAVDNTNQEFLYRGEDAVNVFCNNLNEIRGDIKERMQENKEIEMTDEDKEAFNNPTHCFLCGEEFRNTYKTEKEAEKYKKVRDHCHFTGRYRGCAI